MRLTHVQSSSPGGPCCLPCPGLNISSLLINSAKVQKLRLKDPESHFLWDQGTVDGYCEVRGKERQRGKEMDRWIDGWMDGCMDRWMDG